jgi:hypothetical protein
MTMTSGKSNIGGKQVDRKSLSWPNIYNYILYYLTLSIVVGKCIRYLPDPMVSISRLSSVNTIALMKWMMLTTYSPLEQTNLNLKHIL